MIRIITDKKRLVPRVFHLFALLGKDERRWERGCNDLDGEHVFGDKSKNKIHGQVGKVGILWRLKQFLCFLYNTNF